MRDARSRVTKRRMMAYGAVVVAFVVMHVLLRFATWHSGPVAHTVMEVTATALAAFVAILALVRFYSRKNNTFLFISAGFAGAAVLDGIHSVVTSLAFTGHLASPTALVIPWSWVMSRWFLALMLFLSWLGWRWETRAGTPRKVSDGFIYGAGALLMAGSVAIIGLVPLPRAQYPELFCPRPQELLPAVFFLLALVGYWRKGDWRADAFDHWLMLSLLAGGLGQAGFMAFSDSLHDAMFDAAHASKALSYGMMLAGLLISIHQMFRHAAVSATEAREANRALHEQIAERERVMEALRLEEQRLKGLARMSEMSESALREITDFALEEAVRLTRSTIGYLAFMNDDETVLTMHSWSKTAMAECAIADKQIIYPVAGTGLWGEAVRQRKPVLTNDYEAPDPMKKGYPAGHVRVRRHMNIPVFDGNRIVAVAGVGNKEQPYDESDVQQLQLLMSGMWQLILRKRMLEELRALNETLEKRVAERTALAEQRARELERSNAELEQFAYVASHDLQEPLRMIASYTQLLARRYSGKLDQDADEFIRFAVDGAARMGALINDLLVYSRVGRADKPLSLTECRAILEQAMANLQVSIAETGAVVTADPLPAVMADAVQLTRVFQNLLGNAIKFRGDERPKIHVGAERQNGAWRFSVADNGVGIPAESLGRLFQIFQRLHDRSKYPGSGIGLAVCKKIVERHGGRIWVESVPGRGTTFFFTIPAMEDMGHEQP